MIGRLATLLPAALLLLEAGLATPSAGAVAVLPPEAAAVEEGAPGAGSAVEGVQFVPGRAIPPPAFMFVVAVLGLAVQALRRLGGRALPLVRGVTTLLVFLFLWELAVFLRVITTILLPPPTLVLYRLDVLWLNGHLLWHLLSTLWRFLVSFGIAVGTGLPLGVLVANVPKAFDLLHPVITFVRMIPAPAWAPISILWLGLGDPPAIFIVWLAIFFPIFVNTVRGIHDIPPLYREVIRTMGGSRWDEIVRAVVPCALPAILTGVRVGFGFGWVVLATAELIAVDSGLGWLIQMGYTQVDTSTVLAAMTLVCWMGVLLNALLRQLERQLLPW